MIHLHSTHQTPTPPPIRQPAARADATTDSRPESPSNPRTNRADQQRLQELAARDRQVRTHERAHVAAAGGLANGGVQLQYTRGPDGRQYATGGEVSIDVSAVANDPQATIDKAQKIRRAALAPAEPSQQDRAVAARATAMANEARIELQREARESGAADDPADVGICKQCGLRHAVGDDEKAPTDRAEPYRVLSADPPVEIDTIA